MIFKYIIVSLSRSSRVYTVLRWNISHPSYKKIDELYCVWIYDDVVYVFEYGSKFSVVQLVNPISVIFLDFRLIY
jgi:hypothetical protein